MADTPDTSSLVEYVLWGEAAEPAAVEALWRGTFSDTVDNWRAEMQAALAVPAALTQAVPIETLLREGAAALANVQVDQSPGRRLSILLTALAHASADCEIEAKWTVEVNGPAVVGPLASIDKCLVLPAGDRALLSWDGFDLTTDAGLADATCQSWVEGVRVQTGSPLATLLADLSKAGSSDLLPMDDRAVRCLRRSLRALRLVMPTMADWIASETTIFPILMNMGEGVSAARESFSIMECPNSVWLSLNDPLDALDLLVHECTHLRLGRVERLMPTVIGDRACCLAPWHAGYRPVSYVIHGMAVFAVVLEVFGKLFLRLQPSATGLRKLAIWCACLRQTMSSIDECDVEITPLGRELLAAVMRRERAWRNKYGDRIETYRSWAEGEIAEFLTLSAEDADITPWYLV